jgi:acetoin utilization deacetylase AcuC-like enzyme
MMRGHYLFITALLFFPFLSFHTPAEAGQEIPGQEIWYHTGYPGGVEGPRRGMSALTGPTKMPAIFDAVWRNRLVEPKHLHADSPAVQGRSPAAPPIDLESLRAAHTDRYLKAVLTGEPRNLALSQGLPLWNQAIARGWLLNVGGLSAACEAALRKRSITGNLGHGYHHASMDRGMGFCTLNGLAIVALKIIREGKANRVMIIDLDQHEGNGTADILLGEPRIRHVSIYGSYMGGPPAAANNHVFQVQHGAFPGEKERDANYLSITSMTLPGLIRSQNPELILYQAGMDPHDGAGISARALAIRDAYVFALARSMHIPVTWVLAGGYSDLDTLVQLHTGTVRMANEVLARVKPGDRVDLRGKNPYDWSVQEKVVIFPDWKSILNKNPGVSRPDSMTDAQVQEFVAARQRLFRDQRLPKEEVQAAYQGLFLVKP